MRPDLSDQPTLFDGAPGAHAARRARCRTIRRSQRPVSIPHHSTSVAAVDAPGTTSRASNSGFFRSPVLALIEGQCELLFALPADAELIGWTATVLGTFAEHLTAFGPDVDRESLRFVAQGLALELAERFHRLHGAVIPEVRRCYSAAEALADHGAAA